MKTYTSTICPVCGYDGFDHIPEEFDICPSCHFEFAVNDESWSHEQLRQSWINRGAEWASTNPYHPRPANWSAIRQLRNIGHRVTPSERLAIGENEVTGSVYVRIGHLFDHHNQVVASTTKAEVNVFNQTLPSVLTSKNKPVLIAYA